MEKIDIDKFEVLILKFEDFLSDNYAGSSSPAKHYGIEARLKLKQIKFALEKLSEFDWETWTDNKVAALFYGEGFYYSAFRLLQIFNKYFPKFRNDFRKSNDIFYNITRVRNQLIEHPKSRTNEHINRFGWQKEKGLIIKPKHKIGSPPFENGIFNDAKNLIDFLKERLK